MEGGSMEEAKKKAKGRKEEANREMRGIDMSVAS